MSLFTVHYILSISKCIYVLLVFYCVLYTEAVASKFPLVWITCWSKVVYVKSVSMEITLDTTLETELLGYLSTFGCVYRYLWAVDACAHTSQVEVPGHTMDGGTVPSGGGGAMSWSFTCGCRGTVLSNRPWQHCNIHHRTSYGDVMPALPCWLEEDKKV